MATFFKPMSIRELNAAVTGLTKARTATIPGVLVNALWQVAGQSKKDETRSNGNTAPLVAMLAKFSDKNRYGIYIRETMYKQGFDFVEESDNSVKLAEGWTSKALAMDFDFIAKAVHAESEEHLKAIAKRLKEQSEAKTVDTVDIVAKFIKNQSGKLQSVPELLQAVADAVEAFHTECDTDYDDDAEEISEAA